MSGTTQLACRTCGETGTIQAWYHVEESQNLVLYGVKGDGTVSFDYDGGGRTGEPGEDFEYRCRNCDDNDESLEELLGLPRVEPKTEAQFTIEVFDSAGSAAIKRASEGSDLVHLTRVQGDVDDGWAGATDVEYQEILDIVHRALGGGKDE